MKIEFKNKEDEKKEPILGEENDEVYLATCDLPDDRLLFVKRGKLIMGINLTSNFVIQDHHDVRLYTDLKKVSKLKLKAILEE